MPYGRPRVADPNGSRAKAREANRQQFASLLKEGTRVPNHGNHHNGMAHLKASLGDPRPEVCPCGNGRRPTLSLVRTTGPSLYWGYSSNKNMKPYLLSLDPDDYVWECASCNIARGHPTQGRKK